MGQIKMKAAIKEYHATVCAEVLIEVQALHAVCAFRLVVPCELLCALSLMYGKSSVPMSDVLLVFGVAFTQRNIHDVR
jgi:hypothetical protein